MTDKKKNEIKRLRRLGYTKTYTYKTYLERMITYKNAISMYKSSKSAKRLRAVKFNKGILKELKDIYKIIGGTRKLPVAPTFKK